MGETTPVPVKVCSKCRSTQPISEFHKRKSSKDGLEYQCKACMRVKRKAH